MARFSPLRLGALALVLCSAALAPASVLASPAAEEAEAGKRVALLPIRFEDPLPEADQRELEEVLRTAFEHADIELVEGQKFDKARAKLCAEGVDEACMRALGAEFELTHVVELIVHAQDRDFDLEFRVQSIGSERSPNIVEFECPVCGVAEVRDSVAAQAVLVRDRLLVDSEPGKVLISGTPEGAKISIDGRRVGELPFEGELTSGEHELQISARGYYDRVIPVNVGPGTVEELEVELEPDLGVNRSWQRPLAWSLLGLGSAGFVSGVALLVIDGRPIPNLCSDLDNIDFEGNCRWIYNTSVGGITALSLGIAAASVGATMLVFTRPERAPKSAPKSAKRARALERTRSLRVGVSPSMLQLSGRF